PLIEEATSSSCSIAQTIPHFRPKEPSWIDLLISTRNSSRRRFSRTSGSVLLGVLIGVPSQAALRIQRGSPSRGRNRLRSPDSRPPLAGVGRVPTSPCRAGTPATPRHLAAAPPRSRNAPGRG